MDWIKEIFGVEPRELNQYLAKMGINLVLCIVILIIGMWLSKFISKWIKKLLRRSQTDEGLVTFLSSFLSMVMKVMVVLTAFGQLGIQMTSFVALLGAAGLAVGMAFSGTLSNFAGGVMILAIKPFKVGDQIQTQLETGVVREIQIFNTYLYTSDNKVVIIPNGLIANNKLTNYTKATKRRVDWMVTVDYSNDIQLVKEVLLKIVNEDERVLSEPKPMAAVHELKSDGVAVTLRAWVDTEDLGTVQFDINERILIELPKEGILFPESSLNVQLKQAENA
ncbi:MAG: mechanosensitive ion channel domain-containing protein [Bacteroidota bacterium]